MLDHLGQLPNFAARKFGNKEALNFENRSFSFIEILDYFFLRISFISLSSYSINKTFFLNLIENFDYLYFHLQLFDFAWHQQLYL